jgi:hypothetical protein
MLVMQDGFRSGLTSTASMMFSDILPGRGLVSRNGREFLLTCRKIAQKAGKQRGRLIFDAAINIENKR